MDGKLRKSEWAALLLTGVLAVGTLLTGTAGAEPEPLTAAVWQPAPGQGWQVDLNTADARTLEALPGIGLVLAERIIAYREEHGPFGRPEELKEVSGIGEQTYETMCMYLTVEERP